MFDLTVWPRSAWSIFDDLEAVQANMNRAISGERGRGFQQKRVDRYPLLNVWTSNEGLVVEADMPGVHSEDVDIQVIGDQLTIQGRVNAAEPDQDAVLHRQERPHGEFSRSLKLPFRVDNDKVTATTANGILRITLPRSESEKPRRINVTAT